MACDDRATDLAALAAMELLDVGWSEHDIAAALQRSVEWVRSAFDRAASEAMLN